MFSSCCRGLSRNVHRGLPQRGLSLPLNIESGDGARGRAGESGSLYNESDLDGRLHVQKSAVSSSERREAIAGYAY